MKSVEKAITSFLLNHETTLWGKAKNITMGLVVMIAWVSVMVIFIKFLLDQTGSGHSFFWGEPPIKWQLFSALFMAPFVEELLFRVGPFALVRNFGEGWLVPVLIMSSIVFGLMHGEGWPSVMKQGVCGLILAGVYVKNGFSYWSSVILHFVYNLFWTVI